MKICLIVEGAYPYLTGGVSSWMQQMMNKLGDIEFVIQTIAVKPDSDRVFKYQIPDSVSEIRELYLFDDDYVKRKSSKLNLTKEQIDAFNSLFFGEKVNWACLFDLFQNNQISIDNLITSNDFLLMTRKYYETHHQKAVFSDFIWTLRSMYLPLFMILKNKPIEADIYHSLSTGYAGVYGSLAKHVYNKPLVISEHGIYTREREEEIIKAKWVKGLYKNLWISQFYKFSSCAYSFADQVTALFEGARAFQVELGCQLEKTNVIHNGVELEDFMDIPGKDEADTYINIGAIVRVTPIKDVKTMINAYNIAKNSVKNLKLWIMGPVDENIEYANKCEQLVEDLGVKDVIFTGKINVKDYIGKMDCLVLSSLSEGQPLVILEGFAAKKAFISTNVGDCKDMICGSFDDYGEAGIIVPIMDVQKMAEAMIQLAVNPKLMTQMGLNGYNRAKGKYQNSVVFDTYLKLYENLL